MATAVTADDVRERWPYLTEARIADDAVDLLIVEADAFTPQITQRELAVKHYSAHLAYGYVEASSAAGMGGGRGTVQSASFVDRSVSLDSSKFLASVIGPISADLGRTAPGREYLKIVGATRPYISYPRVT